MVPPTRRIALTVIEPTYCEFIMTTTVRIDQFGCSSRSTSAQCNASKPASPILVPYCTLKSVRRLWSGHSNLMETADAAARAFIFGRSICEICLNPWSINLRSALGGGIFLLQSEVVVVEQEIC